MTSWSEEQASIFEWFRNGSGNLVVRARAGTGKTTTIIEAISHAPERKVLLAAFNKRIATELQTRLNSPGAEAKTLHALGFWYLRRHWNSLKVDNRARGKALAYAAAEEWVLKKNQADKVSKVAGISMEKELNKFPWNFINTVASLTGCAMDVAPFISTEKEMFNLAYAYDHLPNLGSAKLGYTAALAAQFALRAMTLALEKTDVIGFHDMLYLPVRLNLIIPQYEMVCIDEAQDMNLSQLILAQGSVKKGGRIVVVGDDRQAIYQFRGADSNSINRLEASLGADTMTLTTTYRCASKIVEQANKIVPDLRAAPDAPEGRVVDATIGDLVTLAQPGDFILSRVNAPLAKICLSLLRAGVRAKIEGKDIGKKFSSIVKSVSKGYTRMDTVLKNLSAWETKEVDRANAADQESRADRVRDQADTIRCLSEGLTSVDQLFDRFDKLFGDYENTNSFVVLSSIHKAKGLERDAVFILKDTLYPGAKPGVTPPIEEANIEYVAVTRAKSTLVWVKGWPEDGD